METPRKGEVVNGIDVTDRLQRVYASLGATIEADLTLFKPTVVITEEEVAVYQNFVGGLSEAELLNAAFGLVHNIANLRDNVSRWAEEKGKSFDGGSFIEGQLSLCLLQDLSNTDKHGFPLKRKRWSGHSPVIEGLKRVMRMTAAGDGGVTVLTFTSKGPRKVGQGEARVVITGRIVDGETGEDLGDLLEICNDGLSKWEAQLADLGLT